MATGDQQDIAGRLLALLPRWFGDNPPLLMRLLNGLARAHSFIYAMIANARNQTRIKTATGGWLDMIAADFFGRAVLRADGQSDASFLAAIQRNMFRERGTRNAITKALQDLTGSPPVILEPARPADTGAYGANETITIVGTPQIHKTGANGRLLQYPTPRTNITPYSELASAGATVGFPAGTTPPVIGTAGVGGKIVEAITFPAGAGSYNDSRRTGGGTSQGSFAYTPGHYYTVQARMGLSRALYGGMAVFANAPASGATVDWSGTYLSASTGQTATVTQQALPTTGDGSNLRFQLVGSNGEIANNQVAVSALYKTDWQGRWAQYTTARTNLARLTQNLTLTPTWTQVAAIAAPGYGGPTGALNAVKLQEDGSNGWHQVYQTAISTTAQTYTAFFDLKAAERTSAYVCIYGLSGGNPTAANFGAYFNLSTGAVTQADAGVTAACYALPNGFYRCCVSRALDANTNAGLVVMTAIGTSYAIQGIPGSGIYVANPQFMAGGIPTSYVPSTDTFTSRNSSASYTNGSGLVAYAPANAARYSYNPANLSLAPVLLLEPAGTNLLVWSQDFTNAAWLKNNVVTVTGIVTSPSGTLAADMLTRNSGNSGWWADCVQQVSVGAGGNVGKTYTASVWLWVASGTATCGLAISDVSYNTYSTSVTVTTSPQRFTFTSSGGTGWSASGSQIGLGISLPNNSSVFAWGAQLEVGNYATSYVPSADTFTSRASPASYTNSSGLIAYAAANTARYSYNPANLSIPPALLLEPAANNLCLYSQDFNRAGGWGPQNLAVTANVTTAPDGTLTAGCLIHNTITTASYVSQAFGTIADNTNVVVSCFFKAGGWKYAGISLGTKDNLTPRLTVDLTTGQIVGVYGGHAPTVYGVIQYPNGWWRVWFANNTYSGASPFAVFLHPVQTATDPFNSFTGDGSSGVYVWGAQLEAGTYLTSYVPSANTFTSRASTATYINSSGQVATAAANVARYSYNPANLTIPPALLLEPASTNLALYSQDFTVSSTWAQQYISKSPLLNSATAPDGTTTACTLTFDANPQSAVFQTLLFNADGTVSVWACAANGTKKFRLVTYNATQGAQYSQDFTATTAWQRFSFRPPVPNTVTTSLHIMNESAGIAGAIYVWGYQAELLPCATAYIPTTTASATRAADVSSSAAGTRAADLSASVAGTRAADVYTSTATTITDITVYSESIVAYVTGMGFNGNVNQFGPLSPTAMTLYIDQNDTSVGQFPASDGMWVYTSSKLLDPVTVYLTDIQVEDVTGFSDTSATPYIFSNGAITTVTDYTISPNGQVMFSSAPEPNAVLDWTGSYYSPMLGQTVNFSSAIFGTGDGMTTSWQIARPYGYALGYDTAGGYGSLGMPMQALITAFKPKGGAIGNLGGYGSSVFGYRQRAAGAWADLGMMQQTVSESDIYAAIEAVRPATSILWTRIAANQAVMLDYTFVLDRSTLGGAKADTLDKSFVLDQSTLDAAPAAQLDQNFTLDTSELS